MQAPIFNYFLQSLCWPVKIGENKIIYPLVSHVLLPELHWLPILVKSSSSPLACSDFFLILIFIFWLSPSSIFHSRAVVSSPYLLPFLPFPLLLASTMLEPCSSPQNQPCSLLHPSFFSHRSRVPWLKAHTFLYCLHYPTLTLPPCRNPCSCLFYVLHTVKRFVLLALHMCNLSCINSLSCTYPFQALLNHALYISLSLYNFLSELRPKKRSLFLLYSQNQDLKKSPYFFLYKFRKYIYIWQVGRP